MSKKFERFKNKKDRNQPHIDKPKKHKRPQHQVDVEANVYKLFKAGYSVEEISSYGLND